MEWNDADRDARLQRARTARTVISAVDDSRLGGLLDGGRDGWGHAKRTSLCGTPLFIKAVPVTDRELDTGLTTANIYRIPTHLNYPFGSPGMGAGRELAFARRSTDWVQTGKNSGFPILLHDRVIDRRCLPGDRSSAIGYSAYGGDSAAMNSYLADREAAGSYLVLVYEDLGVNAVDWLLEHPSDAGLILDEVRSTLRFLRMHDVVHFDVDLFNVVTDGQHAYIADHGLVIDGSVQLTDDERRFLSTHRDFDVSYLILSLAHLLYWTFDALPLDARRAVALELGIEDARFDTAFERLLDALVQAPGGPLGVDPALRSILNRFRRVIDFMQNFSRAARASWNETTQIDGSRLAVLLGESDASSLN